MRPANRIVPTTTVTPPADAFAGLRAELAGLPVGRRIAVLRNRLDLRQTATAQPAGRSTSWLSQVERGELRCDNLTVITELAAILRVPPGLLIDTDLGSVPARGDSCADPPPHKAPPGKRAHRDRARGAGRRGVDGGHHPVGQPRATPPVVAPR